MEVLEIDIAQLVGDSSNANKGTERGHGMLEKSISELGVGRGVVADKNLRLIGGNKTWEAAAKAGVKKVLVVDTDGRTLVVTRRIDMDLSDRKGPARRLAYMDNRVSQVNLDWDLAMLSEDVEMIGDIFTIDELERMSLLQPAQDEESTEESKPKASITFADFDSYSSAEREMKSLAAKYGAKYSVSGGGAGV